jgi:hypothetical protein
MAVHPAAGQSVRMQRMASLAATLGLTPDDVVRAFAAQMGVEVEVKPKSDPVWRQGDVVMVKFAEGRREYLYVRGVTRWPAPTRSLTDQEVNRLFHAGLVRRVRVVSEQPTQVETEKLRSAVFASLQSFGVARHSRAVDQMVTDLENLGVRVIA